LLLLIMFLVSVKFPTASY